MEWLPFTADMLSERNYRGYACISSKAFIQTSDSWLMQRRDESEKINPNGLACFGGGANWRETPPLALRRELAEELPGFVIDGLRPICAIKRVTSRWENRLVFYFLANGRLLTDECHEGRIEHYADIEAIQAAPLFGESPAMALQVGIDRQVIRPHRQSLVARLAA